MSFSLREPSKSPCKSRNKWYLTANRRNLQWYTTIPPSSITSTDVEIRQTFLDTVGRTVLVIKARNLNDDFRGRELIVSYDVPFMADIRKPLVIFGSMVVTFIAAYVIGGVQLKFSS